MWLMDMVVECNRDCRKCSKLSADVDDFGYPWGWECLKYADSVIERFEEVKRFAIRRTDKEQELTDDLIQIITVFANRLYGQRSKKTKRLIDEVKSNAESKTDSVNSDG